MLDLGRPQAGETVVVSAAAGATGSVAGQIARLQGCRAIGIAGGSEKCDWVTREAGFDAAIDYKSEDVRGRLRELCPDGIHIYFDNVGGEILDAALARIARGARIVLCGGIASYNDERPPPGPRNYLNMIAQRARMEGFLVFDYLPRFREALEQMGDWVRRGEIAYREDIQHGFENAPKTFLRLFEGKNIGKQLLKIADPPV
jgi:NADPH-dependent curcumin reductase CurA